MIRWVRLELARCKAFPEGSSDHGYELHLPLTAKGNIDHHWLKRRDEAVFRRFWGSEEEQGKLRHGHGGWMLSFGEGANDEVIFKGDSHRFVEGEYVSIRERDGVTRTFRVAAVH
jgi:hypothetical protein